MKPNSDPHIGHYFGVIKNLLQIQQTLKESQTERSFLFVPDLHSLTSTYFANNDERQSMTNIEQLTYQMVAFYLASGIDPKKFKIFAQSQVPMHTEL